MNRIIKKEAAIYLALFFLLGLTVHFQACIDHPIEHIRALPSSSLGPWHPLFLTLGAYLLVGTVRLIKRGIIRLFQR